MLVVESLTTLIFALLILFILICIVKYRQSILEWISDPHKPDVNFKDAKDLETLQRYGIDDALEKVRERRAKLMADREALRPPKQPKAETGG